MRYVIDQRPSSLRKNHEENYILMRKKNRATNIFIAVQCVFLFCLALTFGYCAIS